MNKLLLLSGTPASGKDTITEILSEINSDVIAFKKHKSAETGRVDDTYIFVSHNEFKDMADNNEFIQHHYRYDRGYGVAKKELEKLWAMNKLPVIHVGKYENIHHFYELQNVEIISILLLVSLDETKKRLLERHEEDSKEVQARTNAFIEERIELAELIKEGCDLNFNLIINNTNLSPRNTAQKIINLIS